MYHTARCGSIRPDIAKLANDGLADPGVHQRARQAAHGAETPDYRSKKKSHYEIWYHMGGMVPCFEGRVGPGWEQPGKRTSDVDYTKLLRELKRRPLDYFRMYYADTALMVIKLADDYTVMGIAKASIADIASGRY